MAVIKAVSSKAAIGRAIEYIEKKEKTEWNICSGFNCCPETAEEEMQLTKELWGKTDGRTYKHFVQSFAPGENLTPETAHELARKFVEQLPLFQGFEVVYATHKDRKHIHTHFIVNSVNAQDGHKIRMSKKDLQEMKNFSDKLCLEYGLTVTRKGKSFEGAQREETTAYKKDTFQLLQKAEKGQADSYVMGIALAVMDVREKAVSRKDFIQKMDQRGIGVNWADNRKYIVFEDKKRKREKEKKYKVRNKKLEEFYHISFGKEDLENEFKINARRTETRTRYTDQYGDGKTAGDTEWSRITFGDDAAYELPAETSVGEQPSEGSVSEVIRELREIDATVQYYTGAAVQHDGPDPSDVRRTEGNGRRTENIKPPVGKFHERRTKSFQR